MRRRHLEPPEWRRVTGPGDFSLYLTPEELSDLERRVDELREAYRPRSTDPSLRPAGARGVDTIQFVLTLDKP
jgi:hypothetical protein